MLLRRLALLTVLASVVLAPGSSAAQSTGGSFGSSSGSWGGSRGSSGGGGFRSSGSSGSFGSGSSSSWRSSSRSGDRLGSSSGGGSSGADRGPSESERWRSARLHRGQPEVTGAERAAMYARDELVPYWGWWLGAWVFVFGLGFAPSVLRRARRRRAAAREERAQLRRLSVGFDWTVRRTLQSRLARLAGSLSIETSPERAGAAREVVALLREHVGGACYVHASAWSEPMSAAPGALARAATELRARFTHETRGRGGAETPELRARSEEGEGLLVVTLLIGSWHDAGPLVEARDRGSLDTLLATFVFADALDGLEVIWSPAEENDRMSSYELERCYPELVRLDDAAAVGTVRCGHCATARPRELRSCPRCGSSEVA